MELTPGEAPSDDIVLRELTTTAVGKARNPGREEYAGERIENSGYEDRSPFAWFSVV
jgi:hypothetical protein